jgi:Pyruvate/2-oxoacid:ferredoxin oxidoreductase delta subunit
VEIEEDGKTVRVSGDHCKGCLVCAVECPARAISLSSSSSPSSLSRRKDS